MKILITVPMDTAGVDHLKSLPEVRLDHKENLSLPELHKIIGAYQGLIIGTTSPLDHETLAKADQLRFIALMGKGHPSLDIETATRKGILVLDAPGSIAVSAAEHTLALILSLARKIPEADASIKRGFWNETRLIGYEVRGKVLGVVGFGRIGSLVAELAHGMRMNVIVYDPHLSSEAIRRKGYRSVNLEELLAMSDILTYHVPLNRETKHLVGPQTIERMKQGVIIINSSASEIIDEDALTAAIIQGKVTGAALDLHAEKPNEEHPLYLSEKVICTPNLSVLTHEAMVESSLDIAKQIVDYLALGKITHAVNLPDVAVSTSDPGKPWLELVETMGRFVIQMSPYRLKGVEIELAGDNGPPSMELLTRSALKGILSHVVSETVNLVNAASLAHERAIQVTEKRQSSSRNYGRLVTLTLNTDQGSNVVAGTLFDDLYPRIVQIDAFELEVMPDGDFLVIFNRDRPGVIADVGESLGRHEINIGQMYNGRNQAGGKAITIVRVDAPVPEQVLHELRGLPNILMVTMVNLSMNRLEPGD